MAATWFKEQCEILGVHYVEGGRIHVQSRRLTISAEEVIELVNRLPSVAHTGHIKNLGIVVVVKKKGTFYWDVMQQLVDRLWQYRKAN